ncbi:response regulator [soil metagenome]
MTSKNGGQTILVVDDILETLDGIESLLRRDGYLVETARDERDAADKACLNQPDLMLVSLDGEISDVIAAAGRIRTRAAPNKNLPVIIFCVGEIKEGNEAAVGQNIYLAHPDNFNQLREFISRLLSGFSNAAQNL